jgi:hypothetical protein
VPVRSSRLSQVRYGGDDARVCDGEERDVWCCFSCRHITRHSTEDDGTNNNHHIKSPAATCTRIRNVGMKTAGAPVTIQGLLVYYSLN